MRKEKWKPEIGEHVFHVCEFILGGAERERKIPEYSEYGFEIVESVVKGKYQWKSSGEGCRSVSRSRLIGDNANNCFYWRPEDYGKKLFKTFEEAVSLAEEKTTAYEKSGMYSFETRPLYRHWKDISTDDQKRGEKQP